MATPTQDNRNTKIIALALIGIYIILRMAADPLFWRNLPEHYSYAFEALFVLISWFAFRDKITLWARPTKKDAGALIIALFSGALVYRAAEWVHVPIPFDLTSPVMIFLLLVLAPILEEFIFRMALWQAFSTLTNRPWLVALATTILFAGGHFAAYWFVPEEFHGFVLYQTFYVVLLGLAAGWGRLRSNAMLSPILIHFGFNLGFFLGSKL